MFCAFPVIVWAVLSAVSGTGSSNTQHDLGRIRRQTSNETYAEEDMCELPEPLLNGRLSPSPVRCPTFISNPACQMVPGTIVPPNYPIFIACNAGYKLNKTNTVSLCLKGNWKPTLPSCVRDAESCTLPDKPTHGVYNSAQCTSTRDRRPECRSVPGTIVPSSWKLKYTCDPDYVTNQNDEYSVCDKGVWSNPIDCIKRRKDNAESCTLPDKPTHGVYNSAQCTSTMDRRPGCRSVPGTIVPSSWKLKYTCDPGYVTNQNDEYSVCDKGVWSNPIDCIEKVNTGFNCPGAIPNVVSPKYAHPEDCRKYYMCLGGINVEYTCHIGSVFKIGAFDGTGKCEDPEDVPGCENYYGDLDLKNPKKQKTQ